MLRQLQTRLEKLERISRQAQQAYEEAHRCDGQFFLLNALAYYFGDPKPGEWEAAWARALGYSNFAEFNRAHHAKEWGNPEVDERYARATRKLLAKFGGSPNVKGKELAEVLKRIHAGLSEEYKRTSEKYLSYILGRLEPA